MARCLFYEFQTHAGMEDEMEQEVSSWCPEVLVLNHMKDDDSLGSGSSHGVELLRQRKGLADRRCLMWAWQLLGLE